jgi:hypothetical protein
MCQQNNSQRRTLVANTCLQTLFYAAYSTYTAWKTINLPHAPGAKWHFFNPSLAFKASTDPIATSVQAALASHQTTDQEETADTTFMVM